MAGPRHRLTKNVFRPIIDGQSSSLCKGATTGRLSKVRSNADLRSAALPRNSALCDWSFANSRSLVRLFNELLRSPERMLHGCTQWPKGASTWPEPSPVQGSKQAQGPTRPSVKLGSEDWTVTCKLHNWSHFSPLILQTWPHFRPPS